MAAAVLIQILIEGAFLKTRVKMRDIIPGSQKKKKIPQRANNFKCMLYNQLKPCILIRGCYCG